jgi:RNA polymerase sigma-70 factor, ECF subfamily
MSHELLVAFRAGLAAGARARFDDVTPALLGERFAAACEAWPGVELASVDFARDLARRLGEDASPETLAACRTSDVYLACAAVAGDPVAERTLVELLAREVEFAARETRATADQSADVRGELHRLLFTAEPKRSAAAASYAGRSALATFLKVMATRELVRAVQRGRREVPREDDQLFALITPGSDPELAILRARYHDGVEGAIRGALGKLEGRSRAVLRYQLVDGWSIDRVGELYGVHRATAARWIATARDELRELIRSEVSEKLGITAGEVDSIIRLVQTRLDISLGALADTRADEGAKE